MLFIPELATPEPALSGSERARNDKPNYPANLALLDYISLVQHREEPA